MPAENDFPTIEVSPATGKENLRTQKTQRWSRSPHPYHRRKGTIPDGTFISERQGNQDTAFSPRTRINEKGTSAFQNDGAIRRQNNTPPSESGTEADDESGAILKELPAPPIRWRKGLRDAEGEETASPLLTPSYLDDDEKRLAIERQFRRRSSTQSPLLTDEETLKIREKFTQRRRAELLRRISETAIMGFVGCVAWVSSRENFGSMWMLVLYSYLCVVSGIYLSYPVRLFYRRTLRISDQKRPWKFLRIPAAFDPATLLYPVLVPLFVAMSITPTQPGVLLPNLMLSISSIPRAILPIHDDFQGYSSFQWFSSLVPLLIAPISDLSTARFETSSGQKPAHHLDAEALALLFPLHQALLPTIGYLTTTSLLPAELQLLSVAMINLLILSFSPQAFILKALLWIGGIAIFCLCGHVLRWGVALARVPSWRFRHPRLRSRDANVLLSAFDDCLHTRLSKWATASSDTEKSSNDENQSRSSDRNDPRSKRLRLAIHKTMAKNPVLDYTLPQSAKDCKPSIVNANPNGAVTSPQQSRNSQRRFTLPSYSPSKPLANDGEKSPKTSRSMSSKRRRFTSLTIAQATTLKRCFAIYVYTMILGIICWPIRRFVSIGALHGQEPVGWALGYLLGHIPLFRQFIFRTNLEDRIALPEPYDAYQAEKGGWSRSMEKRLQGAANVRLLLCAYCVGIITTGLLAVFRLSSFVEVDTRRKVFHGMMVVMFLPATFVDPCFVGLAFELILAIFLLLDLFRASQLPPLSKPLTDFLAPYVDGRDYRGPVIVSHIFLLIGCAIPLWLSLAAVERLGEAPWEGWEVSHRELSMVSGIICVGMGDAAASLIGRRFGRRRWCWSGGKSLEGSLAFALAVVLGLAIGRAWLLLGGWAGDSGDSWSLTLGKATIAALGASLTESVLTGGNDNVIVPVILWLLMKGLRI